MKEGELESIKSEDIKKEKKKGIFEFSIMEHRSRVMKATPMTKPADVEYIDSIVPGYDNVKIPIRIYMPPRGKPPFPTVFYIPGTAFIAHETEFTRVVCSHLAYLSNCQVIVINHRLAPECQFPEGYLDAYHVLKFCLEKRSEYYAIDKKNVVIAGYSSGGNFAALMSLQAKKDNLPISRQILISPVVDVSRTLNHQFKSFEGQDSDISEKFVVWFLDLYLPSDINPRDPDISPFWQSKRDIKGLPPTDIIVGEIDRFRGDAELYYEKLKKAKLNVNKIVMDKETHAYLWYKLAVVETIAERLRLTFYPDTIERSLTNKKNAIIFLNPTKYIEEKKEKGEEKKHYFIKSKL